MTDARRVLGFLDVFGDFDPTPLFVLGGAVTTTMVSFRFVLRRGNPVLAGLGIASREALWFVPAMIAGMLLHRIVNRS